MSYFYGSLWSIWDLTPSEAILRPRDYPLHCVSQLYNRRCMSAVSGHLLYCVCSLWSSPVLCPQSLVISCTVSAFVH
ncbi:unnamed protein product, partial [Staurois parvus]